MTGKRSADTFTRHVLEQMAEQRISAEQVERTTDSPARRVPSSATLGRRLAERDTELGNRLCVVDGELPMAEGIAIRVITIIRIGRKQP